MAGFCVATQNLLDGGFISIRFFPLFKHLS